MMLIDRRTGSVELFQYPPIAGSDMAIKTELQFGDVALAGVDPSNTPITIGIEIKRIDDFLASMENGRLPGHQLPGMLKTYDENWVAVYGEINCSKDGLLTGNKGTKKILDRKVVPYSYYAGALATLAQVGVMYHQARDFGEVARWIATLHAWHEKSKKHGWKAHKSLCKFDSSMQSKVEKEYRDRKIKQGERIDVLMPLTRYPDAVLTRAKIMTCFPGIGPIKAVNIAQYFKSGYAMLRATVDDLSRVKGVHKILAQGIVDVLKEEQ